MPHTFTTSGTTGIPKTFEMSDELMARRVAARAASRAEVFAGIKSIFSDLALASTVGLTNKLWAEGAGVRFFNNGGGSMASTLALFEREDIDCLTANPAGLLNYATAGGPHRFKSILATGAPTSAAQLATLQAGLGAQVFATYGASEVGSIAIADAAQIAAGSVGSLCPGVEIALDGDLVKVKTTTMIDGYTDPALTARYFIDGWFVPGDTGRMRDGLLVLTGRR